MSSATNPYLDFFIWPEQSKPWVEDRVGGKGWGIYQLKKMGLPVPDFFVLSSELWSYWHGSGEWPNGFIPSLQKIINEKNYSLFSVRSSSISEDSSLRSHAGIFHTELNVTIPEVEQAIVNVFMSAQQGSAVYGGGHLVPMAVIIQKMFIPESSGVAFTRKPQGHSGIFCIEACHGLGTGVVDSYAPIQSYDWDRFGQRLNAVQENEFLPILFQRQIVKAGMEIEKKFSCPMDFEWSFADKTIYFLQARPITASLPKLIYYADNNLSESYPGTSSRLTCDFAQKMYGHIYYDAASFLGASPERLEILKPYYEKMVEAKGNHLYYNLNSYSTAMCALPGGGRDLDHWNHLADGELSQFIQLPKYPKFTILEMVKVTWSFFRLRWNYDNLMANFIDQFQKRRKDLKDKIKRQKSSKDYAQLFLNEVDRPLYMEMSILNDLLIMKEMDKGRKIRSEIQQSLPFLELEVLIEEILEDIKNDSPTKEAKIENFLDLYGDCGFEDLKLESRTFRAFPETFHKYLQQKAGLGQKKSLGKNISNAKRNSKTSKDWLSKLIARREEFRLIRSVYFGLFRELIILMWTHLLEEVGQSQKDVPFELWWNLSLDNLRSFASGTLTNLEMIKIAKDWIEPPFKKTFPEFYCHPAEGDFLPYFSSSSETPLLVSEKIFSGQGVSEGIGEGEVLVLPSATDLGDLSEIEDKVIVTGYTDPAWTGFLPHVTALISERGSLLSHVSIISRELKVPAVMGLKNATRLLRTGDKVKVNGSTGQVEILQRRED